ncbi:hypothetical protein GCM10009841_28760 [Microlunatus panaciterrae]|uniref:Cupredoxin-like domain-containing protein n=1 Tax=Microlunatus panaciterrae TaxID=400768 RepID=A0ABS2RH68_9ACTN|nr:hypothetical protein [Microlunatus panaciterrae]MBM7797536.1 hypothetical protein [Microlunatus panaciterrae]
MFPIERRSSRAAMAAAGFCLLAACTPSGGTGASATPGPGMSNSPVSSASPTPAPPSGSQRATAGPSAPANAVTIDIRLQNGKVSPNGAKINVEQGRTVVLNITSDHDDEVHVHGYDLEIPVKAGASVSRSFVADQLGSVEVESHEPSKIIVILNVR